ncbi:hypothetical protein BGZ89_006749 [Linnemannia elongata]|nr:hypothetical protein BGZ89_006749 [Linnemannia elongata]
MTTTRSKGLYKGTIINLDALVRKGRDLKHPKNADPDEKIAYYHKVFKDPPNTAQLMRRIAETVNDGGPSGSDQAGSTSTGRFRLLQLTEKGINVEHIFKAMIYLRDAVRQKARLDDETFVFSRSMYSPAFKELAAELGTIESSLRGVTAQALHSLYERMVYERTNLNKYLMVATGDKWSDTQLSLIAQELVDIDFEIQERETKQKEAVENEALQKAVKEQSTEERGIEAMLGRRKPRKRPAEDLDADEPEVEVQEADELAIDEPIVVVAGPSNIDSTVDAGGWSSSTVPVQAMGSTRQSFFAPPPLPLHRRISSASESTDTSMLSSAHHTTPTYGRPLSSKHKKRAMGPSPDEKINALDLRMSKTEYKVDQVDQWNKQLAQQLKEISNISTTHAKLNEVDDRLNTLIMHLMQEVAKFRKEMTEFRTQMATLK